MSDPIERLNTALEGRYAIEGELGEGGMATVYLAKDLKHNRNVALKVLKPELAAVVGAERFLAEIETTANLQHPHILPLFDSGEADTFLFYVMPYIEGETLRERIDRDKQLPVDEALGIATAVANALHTAHEQGIVHRDIKPGNILLSRGEPLVADFGIALAVGAAGGNRLTETGLSVGTPFYMSPEQATGDQIVGPASDTYALACVLYEMLVGDPPYIGSTAQAVLGKIIQGLPVSATSVRRSIPANVDAALRKALEKLPADRFTGADRFAKALADPGFRHGDEVTLSGAGQRGYWRGTAAFFAATTVVALLWAGLGPSDAPPPIARFELPLGENGVLGRSNSGIDLAISPDGSRIVYRGSAPENRYQLWERSMDDLTARPIPGTVGRQSPAISPDGSTMVFSGGGGPSVMPFAGGPPVRIVPGGSNAAFGSDGMIYYRVITSGIIWRIPAAGGEPMEFARMPDVDLKYPAVLPDGSGLLLTINRGNLEESGIAVVGPEGGAVRQLIAGAMARYALSGHIVYTTAQGTLMAAPFDLESLEMTGPSVAILEGIQVKTGSASQFALSETGTLAYLPAGAAEAGYRPAWVDREGNPREIDPRWTIRGAPNNQLGLTLSPSGDRLAYSSVESGLDVWVKQLDDGPVTKLTVDGSANLRPSWTPSGDEVVFLSNRGEGPDAVWTRRADGSGSPELLAEAEEQIWESLVSGDGEWLVYRTGYGAGDIYARRLGADGETVSVVVTSDFTERSPALSPDGRWLAYSSNESGRYELYVVPFPEGVASARYTVSREGGAEPVWAHSGEELFYLNRNRELVAAQIPGGSSFSVESRDVLFSLDGFVVSGFHQVYDVHPNDEEFLMLMSGTAGGLSDIVVVQNFFEELKERVPN